MGYFGNKTVSTTWITPSLLKLRLRRSSIDRRRRFARLSTTIYEALPGVVSARSAKDKNLARETSGILDRICFLANCALLTGRHRPNRDVSAFPNGKRRHIFVQPESFRGRGHVHKRFSALA